MLQSNDTKIINIHFVYLTNRILKLDYHARFQLVNIYKGCYRSHDLL